MEYRLSDSDLVLLALIADEPGINGYTIRQRVEGRGLDAWAGVGSSSIYSGLKRIEGHRLVSSKLDRDKQQRGPTGRAYTISAKGARALRRAVADALESAREHDPRFNIALAAIELLDPAQAARCLRQRSAFLAAEHQRLAATRDQQRPLPLGASLLFDRILHAVDSERAWTEQATLALAATGPDREQGR